MSQAKGELTQAEVEALTSGTRPLDVLTLAAQHGYLAAKVARLLYPSADLQKIGPEGIEVHWMRYLMNDRIRIGYKVSDRVVEQFGLPKREAA
jgi:hypothetical protein